MHTSLGRIVVALAASVALAAPAAGCGLGPPSRDDAGLKTTAPGTPPVATLAWTTRLDALTQPQVVGRTAVVLERVGVTLAEVAGYDVRTGERRWSHPWLRGLVSSRVTLDLDVLRDADGRRLVVFQERGPLQPDETSQPLVALDPRTGRVVQRSRPVTIRTAPSACEGGVDACLVAGAELDPTPTAYRFDLDDGGLVDGVDLPSGAVPFHGRGLYYTGYGNGARIGRAVGGRITWERPAVDLFGAGYGPQEGWVLRADGGRLVGAVQRIASAAGWYRFADTGDRVVTVSATSATSAAFDLATGRPRWTSTDGDTFCDRLHLVDRTDVRCRIDARITTYQAFDDGGLRVEWDPVRVIYSGFDPATGRTTWQRTLAGDRLGGDLEDYLDDRGRVVSADVRNVRTRAGWRLMSFDDGRLRRTGSEDVFLCAGDDSELSSPTADADGSTTLYGDPLRFPCDVSGDRTPATPTADAVRAGAERAPDGRFIVATPRGLICYVID